MIANPKISVFLLPMSMLVYYICLLVWKVMLRDGAQEQCKLANSDGMLFTVSRERHSVKMATFAVT